MKNDQKKDYMKKPFKMTARVLAHLGEDLIKDESIKQIEKSPLEHKWFFCWITYIYINDMTKDELYSKVAAMLPLKTKDSGLGLVGMRMGWIGGFCRMN